MKTLVPQIVTSPTLRSARRGLAAMRRRLNLSRPVVRYFHQVDDPYSALAARALPHLEAVWGARVIPYIVPPPDEAAAPDAERLAGWSLRDARTLAEGLGMEASFTSAPSAELLARAQAALAGIRDATVFSAISSAIERGFRTGKASAIPLSDSDVRVALARGARARRGHYLGGMFQFEGEWYWGLDRLPYLEDRLARIRPGGVRFTERREVRLEAKKAPAGTRIEAFVSLRSPYTYIAIPRLRALAEATGAELRLRPVLPMVMRGLPVPLAKRLYIMRDTKREAERLGLPFGKVSDPVGAPVERGLAVLFAAMDQGKGADFLYSFLRGVFAEGIDAGSDQGLEMLSRRAGIPAAAMRAALADESWREKAEANRATMLEAGLWGVPSFRVNNLPAHWGQDRLWAVEEDLRAASARNTRGTS
ncbi:DsbA family protein [Glycocaulis abyssi]|uniref:DsbA family protein n=1 Tax=Glycocaulis abyssi TaxID=1433403 RepID=A0ABV9NFD1_9PROT